MLISGSGHRGAVYLRGANLFLITNIDLDYQMWCKSQINKNLNRKQKHEAIKQRL